MSIMHCRKCSRAVDTDFYSDDLIDDVCLHCIEEMDEAELVSLRDSLDSFDVDYIEEILAEIRIKEPA